MSFIKSSVGFAFSTAVRIVAGLLVVKTMAWKLGPEAFGVLGQMMTIVAVSSMLAGGGISVGLTKRLSERIQMDEYERRLGAAYIVYVASSLLVSVGLLGAAQYIATKVFNVREFALVIIAVAVSHWCVGFYNLAQSVFSSRHDVRGLVLINITGTIAGALVFLVALFKWGFFGAAYGLVLMPVMNGCAALWFSYRRLPVNLRKHRWNLDRRELGELVSYSGVMLFSAAAVPMAQLAVRNMLGGQAGWEQVGFWQGLLKISDVYMQFVGVILVSYVLPRFAAAADIRELHGIMRRIFSALLPLVAAMLIIVYLCRDLAITLLFSSAFEPMSALFLPQVAGDFLRICASIVTYIFLARGYRKMAVASELVQAFCLYGFSLVLVPHFGAKGPVYAYCLTSAIVLMLMASAYKWLHRTMSIQHSAAGVA